MAFPVSYGGNIGDIRGDGVRVDWSVFGYPGPTCMDVCGVGKVRKVKMLCQICQAFDVIARNRARTFICGTKAGNLSVIHPHRSSQSLALRDLPTAT